MYIPKQFENTNIELLQGFIEQHSFMTIISHANDSPVISHIPVALDKTQGKFGVLRWHVAKLNPHATLFSEGRPAVCVFQGPHAYISPSWYAGKENVPTWNYAVLHAHGIPQPISQMKLADDLTHMVRYYESLKKHGEPYSVSSDFKAKLIEHIVGFEMEIISLEAKFKLSQNRKQADQESLIQGLLAENTPDTIALATLMQSLNPSL
ncbi:MAG: FMN-binding negative transcriptional regulator [Gammaproteobacteria bacterium]|nr:FMN-binding negative transcriptional regulator [Gammaproteobacteria bacterium]